MVQTAKGQTFMETLHGHGEQGSENVVETFSDSDWNGGQASKARPQQFMQRMALWRTALRGHRSAFVRQAQYPESLEKLRRALSPPAASVWSCTRSPNMSINFSSPLITLIHSTSHTAHHTPLISHQSSHITQLTQHLTYTLISHYIAHTHSSHTTHLKPLIFHHSSHTTHLTQHLTHLQRLGFCLSSEQAVKTTVWLNTTDGKEKKRDEEGRKKKQNKKDDGHPSCARRRPGTVRNPFSGIQRRPGT